MKIFQSKNNWFFYWFNFFSFTLLTSPPAGLSIIWLVCHWRSIINGSWWATEANSTAGYSINPLALFPLLGIYDFSDDANSAKSAFTKAAAPSHIQMYFFS